jgi:hypothetical protein
MAPQNTMLEHDFHFSLPDIPNDTVSRLSKLTFDGGGMYLQNTILTSFGVNASSMIFLI